MTKKKLKKMKNVTRALSDQVGTSKTLCVAG